MASYERELLERLVRTNEQLSHAHRIIEHMATHIGLDPEGETMRHVRTQILSVKMENEPLIKAALRKLKTLGGIA